MPAPEARCEQPFAMPGRISKKRQRARENGQFGGRGKRAEDTRRTRPPAVGVVLYAGYGGSSEGHRRAGVDDVVLVDNAPDCCETLAANHPHAIVMCRSLGAGADARAAVRDVVSALRRWILADGTRGNTRFVECVGRSLSWGFQRRPDPVSPVRCSGVPLMLTPLLAPPKGGSTRSAWGSN